MKPLLATLIMAVTVLILVAAAANVIRRHNAETSQAIVKLLPPNGKAVEINAEVADDEAERTTGLMFRKSLGKNEGMFFIFPNPAIQKFWMKNTLIPLDMIFIAENKTIVKIHHAMPCTSDPCQLYSSGEPVKYVLEVNGNLTAEYEIEEGSRVTIT